MPFIQELDGFETTQMAVRKFRWKHHSSCYPSVSTFITIQLHTMMGVVSLLGLNSLHYLYITISLLGKLYIRTQ